MSRHGLLRVALSAALIVVVTTLAGCSTTGSEPDRDTPPDVVRPGLTVSIDRIEARSSLVPLGLNPDRTMQVPPLDQVQQAGYYSGGPIPGDAGPATIVGHVNGQGRPGIFARLAELRVGDSVVVERDGRRASFTVRAVRTVAKDRFPTAEVYSDVPGPELRLVTCGGALDPSARSYRANVIAFASLDP